MTVLFDDHGWKITFDEVPLPDGRVKKAVRAHRADSVSVIALNEEGKVLMIREFRPFYGEYIWMLPSGRVDKETDTDAGAQRELQEEAGYKAATLKRLWTVNWSEAVGSSNHIYLAKDLTKEPLPQDEDELIEVHAMTAEEALEKVHGSPKVHLPSAYALMRFLKEQLVSS